MPLIEIQNHYRASPDFVQEWLLDYRPDDSKWFGGDAVQHVKQDGDTIHLEQTDEMGTWTTQVNTGQKHTWNFDGRCEKNGKTLLTTHCVERLEAAGDGTDHFVRLEAQGGTLMMRLMLPLMKGKFRKRIKGGFDEMKPVIEAQYRDSQSKA